LRAVIDSTILLADLNAYSNSSLSLKTNDGSSSIINSRLSSCTDIDDGCCGGADDDDDDDDAAAAAAAATAAPDFILVVVVEEEGYHQKNITKIVKMGKRH
jgi:hypothetical protein